MHIFEHMQGFTFISLLNALFLRGDVVLSECAGENNFRTAEQWKDLVVGRCLNYKNNFDPQLLCNSQINCTELWLQIKTAVENQPKCSFPTNNYEEFVMSSQHFVPTNKHLFWSKVYPFVMRYSNKGRKLYTISDTLTGYIFDNMEWCGNSTEPDGIEKYPKSCPGFNRGCQQSAQSTFWATASTQFAREANGEIHVMMNASRSPAFVSSSYFTEYELPNLNATKVSKATILMVHYPSDQVLEKCDSPSIKTLHSRFEQKGIQVDCIDNPRDVQYLMCSEQPDNDNCKSLVSSSNSLETTKSVVLLTQIAMVLYLYTKSFLLV